MRTRASAADGRLLAALAFAAGLGACTGPDRVREIGMLNADTERTARIDAPSAVSAGADFVVTVTTLGSSSCTWPAGEAVTTSGSLVRFTPYDEVPADPQTGCTRDLAAFPHRRTLRLEQPGPAVLRVVGYFGQGSEQVLDSVEVSFQVEP